jgi:hypothetical protein
MVLGVLLLLLALEVLKLFRLRKRRWWHASVLFRQGFGFSGSRKSSKFG